MDQLEANEDAFYRATLLQRLLEEVGCGRLWDVAEKKETGGGWLRSGMEVEREVGVRWGGGCMGGREGGRGGEGWSDHGRVLGSAWGRRLWGVAVRSEIEGTKVGTETRDRIEVGERHCWAVVQEVNWELGLI